MSIMNYICGEITLKETDRLVIETGGIGYELLIHPGYGNRLPALGDKKKIYCHLHVREDILQLFGFPGPEEKALFLKLITISGIGPKVALTITGSLQPDVFALAIMNADIGMLTSIKGIGKKSAERLIVEMKDKVKKSLAGGLDQVPARTIISGVMSEAMEALLVLGYRQDEAEKAISSIQPAGDADVALVIRQALQSLADKRDGR